MSDKRDELIAQEIIDLWVDAELIDEGFDVTELAPSYGHVFYVLEEMLGVGAAGMRLGEEVEKWLLLPKNLRKPIQFADLERKWKLENEEIQAMVDADVASMRADAH